MIRSLRFSFIVLGIALDTGSVKAQLTDNSSTFRNINSSSYFRFYYDNDYFTKTDEYYSQGISFDYSSKGISRFLLSKLLWRPFSGTPKYGVSLNLFAFTPTSLSSDSILYGDRPYNADITLKTYLVQADPLHKQQISMALSLGIMGPIALGHEIQYGIHKWLKNSLPHGWENQVQNDVIINYQLNYEKQLLAAGNNFLLNTAVEARLGTFNDRLGCGLNFMAGWFNKRFLPVGHKKAEYYFFAQSLVNFVGYDASLQGGVFNRLSPYTITAADINRVTFQQDAGIIVNFRTFYLSYTQSFITKEFRSGKYHRWGGISIGFSL